MLPFLLYCVLFSFLILVYHFDQEEKSPRGIYGQAHEIFTSTTEFHGSKSIKIYILSRRGKITNIKRSSDERQIQTLKARLLSSSVTLWPKVTPPETAFCASWQFISISYKSSLFTVLGGQKIYYLFRFPWCLNLVCLCLKLRTLSLNKYQCMVHISKFILCI